MEFFEAFIDVMIALGMMFVAAANPAPLETINNFSSGSFVSTRELFLACLVLLLGVSVGVFCIVLTRLKVMDSEQVIRISALLLIVTGTLLLVSTGYDANQIAPALGLLGTVAGYLLGRADSVGKNKTEVKAELGGSNEDVKNP